jgi:hypothetical protein
VILAVPFLLLGWPFWRLLMKPCVKAKKKMKRIIKSRVSSLNIRYIYMHDRIVIEHTVNIKIYLDMKKLVDRQTNV